MLVRQETHSPVAARTASPHGRLTDVARHLLRAHVRRSRGRLQGGIVHQRAHPYLEAEFPPPLLALHLPPAQGRARIHDGSLRRLELHRARQLRPAGARHYGHHLGVLADGSSLARILPHQRLFPLVAQRQAAFAFGPQCAEILHLSRGLRVGAAPPARIPDTLHPPQQEFPVGEGLSGADGKRVEHPPDMLLRSLRMVFGCGLAPNGRGGRAGRVPAP